MLREETNKRSISRYHSQEFDFSSSSLIIYCCLSMQWYSVLCVIEVSSRSFEMMQKFTNLIVHLKLVVVHLDSDCGKTENVPPLLL